MCDRTVKDVTRTHSCMPQSTVYDMIQYDDNDVFQKMGQNSSKHVTQRSVENRGHGTTFKK